MKKLTELEINEVSLVSKGANNKKFLLYKSESGEPDMSKTEPAGATKTEPSEAPVTKAEVTKADLDAIRKEMELVQKEKEELKKAQEEAVQKAAELEKALASEKDARLTKEYIEKAAIDMPLLGKSDEVGVLLKTLSQKAPEETARLETMLKAANERIKAGDLFKEAGRSGGEVAGSAWSKIDKAAEELSQKDVKLSKAQAIDVICKQHPEWYAEHRKEVI